MGSVLFGVIGYFLANRCVDCPRATFLHRVLSSPPVRTNAGPILLRDLLSTAERGVREGWRLCPFLEGVVQDLTTPRTVTLRLWIDARGRRHRGVAVRTGIHDYQVFLAYQSMTVKSGRFCLDQQKSTRLF